MIEIKAKNNTGKNKITSIEGDLYFIPVVGGVAWRVGLYLFFM